MAIFTRIMLMCPGWLIEMECMGVKECKNKEYAPF